MTTLCFDFGNTRQKVAVFVNGELGTVHILSNHDTEVKRLIEAHRPDRSILSSVIDHRKEIETLLSSSSHFHLLSNTSKLPFSIPVGKPETVGADRLAICAAAVHLFPNTNTLAIGTGSCITYNFINTKNEFMGGAISPGMEMRFRAMHEYTAKLPLVEASWNVPLIGYDTKTNLQTGVVFGIAKEIDGMIDSYKERYGNFNALLTGGDTGLLQPLLKNEIFADPDLIFKGLYAICQINAAE